MIRKLAVLASILLLVSCNGSQLAKAPEPEKTDKSLTWQTVKVFASNADEQEVSYRYPYGRWLETAWIVQKPEFAKIAKMHSAKNGIICEGLGLLDLRGKTISQLDKMQTVSISDGDMLFTTNPQTSDYVLAIRTDDGATAWQSRIGEHFRGEGSFFLEQGNLVFALETPSGYRITRFDRKSGSVVWQNVFEIESGFSTVWTQGSGYVWILTTVQTDRMRNILSRISARDGQVQTFDCPFRKPFVSCGTYLWYLDREKLFRFDPETGQTVSVPAKDAITAENVAGFVLVNSTKQPKLLDPKDATIHMLYPDQVKAWNGVVFQLLQKMVVAVDPISRDELWKMDFNQVIQEVAFSQACVAVQTTDKIYFFTKR
jgi:hypothetical protein